MAAPAWAALGLVSRDNYHVSVCIPSDDPSHDHDRYEQVTPITAGTTVLERRSSSPQALSTLSTPKSSMVSTLTTNIATTSVVRRQDDANNVHLSTPTSKLKRSLTV